MSRFIPVVQRAIRITGFALGLVAVLGLSVAVVTARHNERAAREQLCAAKLAALRARNPLVARYMVPADPCRALQLVVAGEK